MIKFSEKEYITQCNTFKVKTFFLKKNITSKFYINYIFFQIDF